VEYIGMLDNDRQKLIFREWKIELRGQLRIGSILSPLAEPEEIGVSGLDPDDLVAQIYTRRTSEYPGARLKVEDISKETFIANMIPFIFTRPRSEPPAVGRVAFTDGAFKRLKDQEELLFGTINRKAVKYQMGAGAAVYERGRLAQIIETLGLRQAGIAGPNAFIMEMIAVLALLVTLGDECINSTIYSDCNPILIQFRDSQCSDTLSSNGSPATQRG
jgi:hypothetical protein